ncbi:MAG: transglutaminase-like domain-containing protein [Polyangiales bacterium]
MTNPSRLHLPTMLRVCAYFVTGAVLALPLSRAPAVVAAALGAALGAVLGGRLARSPYRTIALLGAGLLMGVLAGAVHTLLLSATSWSAWLGPARAYRTADALLAMGVLGGGAFALRVLTSRRAWFAVLEVLVPVFAFTQLVVAHRDGAINRPFEIADPILATGGDPTLVFLGVGVVAVVSVSLVLLSEERVGRLALHFGVLLALLAVLVVTTRLVGMPTPPEGGAGLGLRPEDGEASERRAQGQSSDSQGQGGGPGDMGDFRDDYETPNSDVPVGVVIFRDDYSAPTGTYYFRQGAFSQWNGRRLVASTLPEVDRDLVQGFPVESTSVREPPPLNAQRREVETTVVLLADHTLPFALESPLRLRPAPNPDPSRFRVAYHATSASLSADYFALLQAPAGSPSWTAEARAEYLAAPADPRYRELAERILAERVPADLRHLDAAKVFAITEWLGEHGFYSLRSQHAGADDPTADFLFGDLTGYCVHFSHAATFLFRAAGVPARVATGYAIPESNRQGGSALLVTGQSSHAWPEVYFEGFGWVVTDVFPHESLDPPGTPPDADLQRLLGELARGQSLAPEDASDEAADVIARLIEHLPALGWGALAGVLLLWLALYVAKLYRRVAYRFASDAQLARALHRAALDRLSEVSLRRARGETREAFAQRVAGDVPSLARVAAVAEGRALGSPRATAVPRAELLALGVAVRREHARAFRFRRRLFGALLPWTFLQSR